MRSCFRRGGAAALLLASIMPAPGTAAGSAPGSPVPPPELRLGDPLSLDALVDAVLERNQSLAAAEAARRAAVAIASAAGELANPRLELMLAPLSLGGGRPGFEARVSQELPMAGRRHLRREAAEAEAVVAREALNAARVELVAQATSLYADLYLDDRELEINQQHVALLDAFQRVATARYAAGLVPQQAPLLAEVESARMRHHEIELRSRRRTIVARIDALLNEPPDAPVPPPPPSLASHEHAGATPDVDRDTRDHPALRAQAAAVAARRAELELARRANRPSLDAMAWYGSMWDMREDRLAVGIGIELPVRRARIAADIATAQARLDQASAELERRRDQVRADALAAISAEDEAAHLLELYRDRVLPAARDEVAAVRISFESGQESMLTLIEAERSLRDAEDQYQQSVAESIRAHAEVDRALGRSPDRSNSPSATGEQP